MPKVAITGAASGIGAAVVERLAAENYDLVLLDINSEALDLFAQGLNVGCVTRRCDVTNELSVTSVFADIGPLYGLVCCAGGVPRSANPSLGVAGVEVAEWDWTFNLNTRGAFLCFREFVRNRRLHQLDTGRVVLFSSVAGQNGGRAGAAYAASKAAVLSLVRSGAAELASEQITVNAVAPGPIDTPAFAAMGPEFRAQMEKRIPVGRIGTPGEVASAVSYLLSPDAAFITGATIDVNGGVLTR